MPEKPRVLYVPSDFEYLDPRRPPIRYESDLSEEERQRMAPGLEAMHQRAAQGLQPPWVIQWPDGSTTTV